jgi:hypothetical protein
VLYFSKVIMIGRTRWLLLRFITTTFLFCSPLIAQQSGVLLGYGEQTSEGGYDYKTMWIVMTPDGATVVATVPDVIAPRSTGFWRVGRTMVCEFDVETQQDSARDALWQTPLEKAPVIQQGPPCKSHRPGDFTEDEENTPSDSAGPHVNLCGRESGKLLFVSPNYIGEEFDAWDGCDARGGHDMTRDHVRAFDNSSPLSLNEIVGEQAAKAYGVAAEKGFSENSKEFNCPEPDAEQYDLKSWNIKHVRGAWRPIASLDMFMGECAFSHPMNLELPKSVTGEPAQSALWSKITAAVPRVLDFYLSPFGDFALVFVSPKNAEYHLYAYSAKDGVPGKRLAEIPWDNSNSRPIVMAQWSSGKYLSHWTDVITKIKEHPLPAPVAQPGGKPVAIKMGASIILPATDRR